MASQVVPRSDNKGTMRKGLGSLNVKLAAEERYKSKHALRTLEGSFGILGQVFYKAKILAMKAKVTQDLVCRGTSVTFSKR